MATARARNDSAQYDDLIGEWWKPRGALAMLQWIAEARAALVPPADRRGALLVDLGCGGGLMAPHAARLGYDHLGVDVTASALAVAAAHGVRAVRGDAGRAPLRSGVADVVCAGEILEHVADADAVVREACRLLRPGGHLVVDTIAGTRLAALLAVEVAERLPGAAPAGIHDPALFVDRRRLRAVAASAGVPLQLRGLRPAWLELAAWAAGRRGAVRMVPTFTTSVLFQAWGVKGA